MHDLHIHSCYSDGSNTLEEIFQLANELQLTTLSITDHDTFIHYSSAKKLSLKYNIQCLPALELSCWDEVEMRKVHLLGYFVPENHPQILNLITPLQLQREEVALSILKKLQKIGYPVSFDAVLSKSCGSIYKQHVMHALIDAEYTDSIFGELFHQLFSNKDGQCYFPLKYLPVEKTIHAILAAGGLPVIAHPAAYKNISAIPRLVKAGLLGIEVYHSRHNKNDISICQQLATFYNLIVTGGTDFHGYYSRFPEINIGDIGVNAEELHILLQKAN
ncbi:MAG: PHP domain-containing protein [Clostridia bacterium]